MPHPTRVALITGCGKPVGIGNSTARALAAKGIAVVVSDVRPAGVANEFNAPGDTDTNWSIALLADKVGVPKLIDQQFAIAHQILAAGLVPIVEPEIDIHSPQKAEAEVLLKAAIEERLGRLWATSRSCSS